MLRTDAPALTGPETIGLAPHETRLLSSRSTPCDHLPPAVNDRPVPAIAQPSLDALPVVDHHDVDERIYVTATIVFSRSPVQLGEALEPRGSGRVCLQIRVSTDEGAVRELEHQSLVEQLSQSHRVARSHRVVQGVLRVIDGSAEIIISRHATRVWASA